MISVRTIDDLPEPSVLKRKLNTLLKRDDFEHHYLPVENTDWFYFYDGAGNSFSVFFREDACLITVFDHETPENGWGWVEESRTRLEGLPKEWFPIINDPGVLEPITRINRTYDVLFTTFSTWWDVRSQKWVLNDSYVTKNAGISLLSVVVNAEESDEEPKQVNSVLPLSGLRFVVNPSDVDTQNYLREHGGEIVDWDTNNLPDYLLMGVEKSLLDEAEKYDISVVPLSALEYKVKKAAQA